MECGQNAIAAGRGQESSDDRDDDCRRTIETIVKIYGILKDKDRYGKENYYNRESGRRCKD